MTYGLDRPAPRFTEDDGFSPQDLAVLFASGDGRLVNVGRKKDVDWNWS